MLSFLKKHIIFLFFLVPLGCQSGCCQNLVPNWSFEDTSSCPFNLSQIDMASGWSSFRGSPDYFNLCSSSANISVPKNIGGYQVPKSGNAYAAFIAYVVNLTNTREFIAIKLLQPLTIMQKYFTSFYVSLARGYDNFYYPDVACNKIGLQLSTISFSGINPLSINNYSHVYTDSIIIDTINWVKISGSFIADSAYEYLIVGNFYEDSLTTYSLLDTVESAAIYYLDDIKLSTDSSFVNNVENIQLSNSAKIYPNPFSNFIIVDADPYKKYEYQVTDITGRIIKHGEFSGILEIESGNWQPGMYFLQIFEGTHCTVNQKIIKAEQ